MCTQVNVQAREPPTGFETHGDGHTKSKIGAVSGPTKWTLVQQKILKKKTEETLSNLHQYEVIVNESINILVHNYYK